jgi:hypothetical protein
MGHRTLKRVPLDFQWPKGKVWKGYINPHKGPIQCIHCDGSGHNPATKQIDDDFYDFAGTGRRWFDKITQSEVETLVQEGQLMDFTHEWKEGTGWQPKHWETKGFWCPKCHDKVPQLNSHTVTGNCWNCKTPMLLLEGDDVRLHMPTADQINRAQHTRRGFSGHDGINRWILIKARAKRLGVWGKCPACKGHGNKFPPHTPHRPYKAWKEYEPPKGSGYQLWESVSEGSPQSPVFASIEELSRWCERNATVFADEKTSYCNWLKMFKEEDGVDVGSFFIASDDYAGSAINATA